MSSKLLIRKAPSEPYNPSASAWAQYQLHHPIGAYPDLDLPPVGLVTMMDGLMLRVQAGIRPTTTWRREDSAWLHTITMRWQSQTAQLQLEAHLGSLGVHFWLHPCFGDSLERRGVDSLAYWNAHRCTQSFMWDNEYGKLEVYRLEENGVVTFLRFDDPLFDGIPRREHSSYVSRPNSVLAELGDNIIATVQRHLVALGIA